MANTLSSDDHIRLWNAFRAGNRAAFTDLYDLFAADLYRYGYNLVRNRQVVEDCLHELFLHLHEHRERLGPTDNIRFYLFRALRRRITDTVDRLNKLDSDPYLFTTAAFTCQPYETTLVDEELADHRKQVITMELNKLPRRQKEILYLVYMKGLSYQQVTEVMGITMKSVYNTMNVALTTLRSQMRASFEAQDVLWNLAGVLVACLSWL